MRWLILVLVILFTGFGYWHWFHPPVVLERHTEQALDRFSEAVNSKDRTRIGQQLNSLLAEAATVRLEVGLLSFVQQQNKPVLAQDFTKQQFIGFIDNTLYPMMDYGYRAELQSFTLSEDRQTASVTFSSKEWGDGISHYGGAAVNMRFSSDTACNANLHFMEKQPVIDALSCAMNLRSVPKPGEAQKIQQNTESLKQLLR